MGSPAAGDRPEFERFVAEHYDRVYRFVRRLTRDPIGAEDLTQEAFFRAYRGWLGFRGEASAGTWILRIAQNLVRDGYRRAARGMSARTVPMSDQAAGATADPAASPAQAAEQRQSGECVRWCVQALPEPYRQVVFLRDLFGLPNAEIARRVGASVEAVKMRVHRGRELFRAGCAVDRDGPDGLFCIPAAGRSDHDAS